MIAEKFVGMVEGASCGFYAFPKNSASALCVSRNFTMAQIRFGDAGGYLTGSIALAIVFSVPFLVFCTLLFDFPDSIAYSLVAFGACFFALLRLPALLAWRACEAAEAELPFLLREFAVYVEIGLPFEKCVGRISKSGYMMSREFSKALLSAKSGSAIQHELSSISARFDSLAVKRAIFLLSSIYETGASAENLKRAADELAQTQLSKMRLQSGKLSLLAIAFVTSSALIPSFFTVFVSVSPLVSQEQFANWQIWASFLLLFPSITLFVLAGAFLLLPPSPSWGRRNSQSENLEEEFLIKAGFLHGKRAFIAALVLTSLLSCLVLFVFGFGILSLLPLVLAPCALALLSYFSLQGVSSAEKMLPDALYAAASTHKLLSPERMLAFLEKGGFGRLSEAFGIALRQMKAGGSFQDSMQSALSHCPSPLTARAISMIVVAYETGADMYFALRETAQDTVSFFLLVQERSALLSIQQYTVLAATAILVPIILGAVLAISPTLSSAASIYLVNPPTHSQDLIPACQAYLAINCALSSLLLAMSETDPKKAALYFAFCLPVSQAVFFLASSGAMAAVL